MPRTRQRARSEERRQRSQSASRSPQQSSRSPSPAQVEPSASDIQIRSLATKEYSNALKEIGLLKDVGYHQWKRQMEVLAETCGWHDSILTGSRRPSAPSYKYQLDNQFAYKLILNKTGGHDVASILESSRDIDAAELYRLVNEYFVSDTPAGVAAAYKQFHFSSMDKNNVNVLDWGAAVRRNAQDLRLIGQPVADSACVSVYLMGLLPEFAPIKNILDCNSATQSFADVERAVRDYARKNNLLGLTKHSQSTKNRSFNVHDKNSQKAPNQTICYNWSNYRCKFGDDCFRKHVGPGGYHPSAKGYDAKKHARPTTKPQPSAQCNICSGRHGIMQCPLLPALASAGMAKSNASESPTSSVTTNSVSEAQRPPPIPANVHPQHPHYSFSVRADSSKSDSEPSVAYDCPVEPAPDCDQTHTWVSPQNYVLMALSLFTGIALTHFYRHTSACWLLPMFVGGLFACSPSVRSPPALPAAITASLIVTVFVALCIRSVDSRPLGNIAAQSYFSDHKNHPSNVYDYYEWCSDTGTNRFVTNDIHDFVPGSVVHKPTEVAVGGGTATSPCYGTVHVRSSNHDLVIEANDVLLLPFCSKKLMPAHQFLKKGCRLTFEGKSVTLYNRNGEPILSGKEIDKLYHFKCQTIRQHKTRGITNSVNASSLFGLPIGKHISQKAEDFGRKLLETHWAYGHMHFDKIRKMCGLKKGENPTCPACVIANQRQKALSDHAHTRSGRICHRMWIDMGFTAGCDVIFQLYVDDFSRESFLDILDNKSDCLSKWIDLKKRLENDNQPWKFAYVKTDSEPVYWSKDWENHCDSHHLVHEFSSPYKHGQNGVVERAMQTIGTSFRAMMITGNAPDRLAPHALRHANLIRNHSPTTANNGRTPLEKKLNRKLPLNKRLLQAPLFCLAFAHVYEEERNKNADRGVPCVYLGYDAVNNSYLLMDWKTSKEYYCADVTFFPNQFPFRMNPDRTGSALAGFDDIAPHLTSPIPTTDMSATRSSTRIQDYKTSGGVPLSEIPDVDTPPDAAHANNDDNASQSFIVHPAYGPDPETMEEARKCHDADDWIQGELTEKEQFKALGVYEVVPRSYAKNRGKRIYRHRLVLKRKFNPPDDENPFGTLDKHRVRLTIAAYKHLVKEGVDFKEKHASTVRWNAVKLLINIAVQFDYDITLVDISTFFLYGEMDEEVYMEIPPGWEEDGKSRADYVWKLKKSVYGWPAASNRAQATLKKSLTKEEKLRPTAADDCVYVTKNHSTGYAACGTHVDDIVMIGDDKGKKKFLDPLSDDFKIKVKHNPTSITGVELIRDRKRRWAKLHQHTYTMTLLDKYSMLESNPSETPMDPGTAKTLMLLPQDEFTKDSIHEFHGILGSLIWLCCRTRPDLAFTVNLLSRYANCASAKHVKIIKNRPLRYLNGTRDYGIVIWHGQGDWVLSGHADADLAGDLNTARSTISYQTQLGQFGNISFSSKLERKICTSTGQAETYAFASLVKEVMWERLIMSELGLVQCRPTICNTDNNGVILQSKNPINHASAKHYRISQALIRQVRSDQIILPNPIDTKYNVADMGTKPLPADVFKRHRDALMGPQTCP